MATDFKVYMCFLITSMSCVSDLKKDFVVVVVVLVI